MSRLAHLFSAPAVGIDLGGSELAAVQLGRDGRTVAAAVSCPRRHGREHVTEEIPRLVRVLARRGVRPGPVILSLPDAQVTIAELSLPTAAGGSVLREMVTAQLARIRQTEGESLVCGWWSTDEASAPTRRSLATAVDRALAESVAQAFEECGLDVAVIEPRPLALARACRRLRLAPLEVIVDRSGPETMATVLERGKVSYVRPIAVRRAEGEGESRRLDGGLDALLGEIRLTLGYLVHRHPAAALRRLLLAGEPKDIRALADLVPESIGLPAETLSLAEGAEEGCDGRFCVALGLAMPDRRAA